MSEASRKGGADYASLSLRSVPCTYESADVCSETHPYLLVVAQDEGSAEDPEHHREGLGGGERLIVVEARVHVLGDVDGQVEAVFLAQVDVLGEGELRAD